MIKKLRAQMGSLPIKDENAFLRDLGRKDRLQKIAPLFVARGSNDKEWAERIPGTLTFQIEDSRFFLVRNKKKSPKP